MPPKTVGRIAIQLSQVSQIQDILETVSNVYPHIEIIVQQMELDGTLGSPRYFTFKNFLDVCEPFKDFERQDRKI